MAGDGALSRWLHRPRPVEAPRARLVCFPHSGGTASFYRDWPGLVPGDVEVLPVQYPGREERLREPLAGDMGELADRISDALAPEMAVPVTLFGHSLGAVVAYEVAVRLRDRCPAVPHALVVSGHPGPGRERPGAWHSATDAELCAELLRLGGTRKEVLDHPELLRLVLPIVRGDYRLTETRRMVATPLGCPVLACVGAEDTEVTAAEAEAWAAVTTADFAVRVFPGGHFYLTAHRRELIAEVIQFALPPVSPSPAVPSAAPARSSRSR